MAFVLLPSLLSAQNPGESCQDADPTQTPTNCPLDTWVWVLVAGAILFGAVTLAKKQAVTKSGIINS